MIRALAALVLIAALASCGAIRDSRLNPFNWFGRSQAAQRVDIPGQPVDARGLVADVLSMTVEPLPTGALVRATGLSPRQGYWDAALVAQPVTEDGLLVLEFRIFPPIEPTDVNTPRSREVTAAISLSRVKLETVREIVVQGANNARASRR